MNKHLLLILTIFFVGIIQAEQLKIDLTNEKRFALNCSGKHPGRNIQHTTLFLIDRERDILEESRYCGSFKEVDIVMGSTKDNRFIWYSPSPFIINGYGEKILDLKELTFEYAQTWRRSSNALVRGNRSWSAQCKVINREDAIKLQKGLRC